MSEKPDWYSCFTVDMVTIQLFIANAKGVCLLNTAMKLVVVTVNSWLVTRN